MLATRGGGFLTRQIQCHVGVYTHVPTGCLYIWFAALTHQRSCVKRWKQKAGKMWKTVVSLSSWWKRFWPRIREKSCRHLCSFLRTTGCEGTGVQQVFQCSRHSCCGSLSSFYKEISLPSDTQQHAWMYESPWPFVQKGTVYILARDTDLYGSSRPY